MIVSYSVVFSFPLAARLWHPQYYYNILTTCRFSRVPGSEFLIVFPTAAVWYNTVTAQPRVTWEEKRRQWWPQREAKNKSLAGLVTNWMLDGVHDVRAALKLTSNGAPGNAVWMSASLNPDSHASWPLEPPSVQKPQVHRVQTLRIGLRWLWLRPKSLSIHHIVQYVTC